jgi:enoyl-CoA hydratase/carnithine racemase
MIRSVAAGDVRKVILDRPERRNALRSAGLDDLARAVVDAREARRMGLVSRVVADPREVAASVAANDAPPDRQHAREAEAFAACHAAGDIPERE